MRATDGTVTATAILDVPHLGQTTQCNRQITAGLFHPVDVHRKEQV